MARIAHSLDTLRSQVNTLYIISNHRIAYSSDWKWQPYDGANAHTQHVHISVANDPAKYDDARHWKLVVSDNPFDQTPDNIKKLQTDINTLKVVTPALKVDGELGPSTFSAIVKLVAICKAK